MKRLAGIPEEQRIDWLKHRLRNQIAAGDAFIELRKALFEFKWKGGPQQDAVAACWDLHAEFARGSTERATVLGLLNVALGRAESERLVWRDPYEIPQDVRRCTICGRSEATPERRRVRIRFGLCVVCEPSPTRALWRRLF